MLLAIALPDFYGRALKLVGLPAPEVLGFGRTRSVRSSIVTPLSIMRYCERSTPSAACSTTTFFADGRFHRAARECHAGVSFSLHSWLHRP